MDETKRVFFALEVHAPWPEDLPKGRLLEPADRHATLAFLGEITYTPLIENLNKNFPPPPFQVGLVGSFSKCLFLPPRHPNVVAWQVHWIDDSHALKEYYQTFIAWLKQQEYPLREHPGEWLCHVTLCRSPFDYEGWKKAFKPLPMAIYGIHLYESLGHSKYKPIWSFPLIPPFQEFEHTADLGYLICGENFTQLHRHAQAALAFRYPPILQFIGQASFDKHEDIIMDLNDLIAKADASIGCPFKAISFHGNVEEKNKILQWEMIVDV